MQQHIQVIACILQHIKETERLSTFLRFTLGSLSDWRFNVFIS